MLELLAMVCLACERAPSWRGKIVFFIVDNDNAKHAVNKHSSRNRYARFLLSILSMFGGSLRVQTQGLLRLDETQHSFLTRSVGKRSEATRRGLTTHKSTLINEHPEWWWLSSTLS